jgi:zinc D-Ala-D-Ala carboxypeptidase
VLRLLALLAAVGAVLAALGFPAPKTSSRRCSVPVDVRPGERLGGGERSGSGAGSSSGDDAALGEAGGAIPSGTTVFADDVPGVAKLDPDLRGALRKAATAARAEGVELLVDSGWRSAAYQERLRSEAVAKYGSAAEAARWVATAKTSAHVAGEAVDIGPSSAAAWLSAHGPAYGLCRIYGNEPWHFERRPDAASQGCPAMYADPTHDPRMQK